MCSSCSISSTKDIFMNFVSDVNQSDIVEAFNATSSYLDNLFNIDNSYFDSMAYQIYPPELQLNRANDSDTNYDKRDDFDIFPHMECTFHNLLGSLDCVAM